MKPTSDTFCVLPWIHASVGFNGQIYPCCKASDSYSTRISDISPADMLDIPDAIQLRKDLDSGVRSSFCQKCWDEEDAGVESKRQRENARWAQYIKEDGDVKIRFVDMRMSTLCNLKCRTCNSVSSSKWIKEERDVMGKTDGKLFKMTDYTAIDDTLFDVFEHVELIEIYGGEPLLVDEHFEILEECVRRDYAKNIRLSYVTNGTVLPKKVKTLWDKFKNVTVMLSMDGVGKEFEYMRHPGKWSDFNANTQQFRQMLHDNIIQQLGVCYTASALNFLNLINTHLWAQDNNLPVWLNVLHYPDCFSLRSLPQHAKNLIERRLTSQKSSYAETGGIAGAAWPDIQDILEFMNEKSHTKSAKKLQDVIARHDTYRGEQYSKVFPEFANILNTQEDDGV